MKRPDGEGSSAERRRGRRMEAKESKGGEMASVL